MRIRLDVNACRKTPENVKLLWKVNNEKKKCEKKNIHGVVTRISRRSAREYKASKF